MIEKVMFKNISLLSTGGKMVKDEESLESLGVSNGGKLYFKDLGPQVGWTTVGIFVEENDWLYLDEFTHS